MAEPRSPSAPPTPVPNRHQYDPLPVIIPECSINLLAGPPGVGKSALMAWFARQFAANLPIFGQQPSAVPYQAIIAADRSWDNSTKLWFELEDMGDLPAYSIQDDRAFKKARLRRKQDRVAILQECIYAVSPEGDGKFPRGSLIWVDPLGLFLGGNLLDYDTCLVGCSEIREICLALGITIIGTAHASKQKADKREQYLRLQDRILGSAALFGYTDTQMYIASPEEMQTSHYTFLWHPHHAPAELFALERDDHGRFRHTGRPVGEGQPRDRRRTELLAYLLETFQTDTGEATTASLEARGEHLGASRASVHRRLRELREAGTLTALGSGRWKLIIPS